ncbi:hypothetical protein ATCC90586_003133 [Pythium insidiosum]|nr:hypothetical protein ATCC90586_003133 [Pythium insidiosum]
MKLSVIVAVVAALCVQALAPVDAKEVTLNSKVVPAWSDLVSNPRKKTIRLRRVKNYVSQREKKDKDAAAAMYKKWKDKNAARKAVDKRYDAVYKCLDKYKMTTKVTRTQFDDTMDEFSRCIFGEPPVVLDVPNDASLPTDYYVPIPVDDGGDEEDADDGNDDVAPTPTMAPTEPEPVIEPSPYVPEPEPIVEPSPYVPQPEPIVEPSPYEPQPEPIVEPSPYMPEPHPEPVIEPSPYVPEPHPEPVIEPSPYVPEPHPEPVIEPSPYVPEPHPEPVIEPSPYVPEPHPEPVIEPSPYVPEPHPEPVIEPSPYVPEPHPEPVIEPSPYVPEPHPEPVIEPSPYVPEPHPEPVIEPSPYVPEPHPEPVIEPSPYVPEPHPEPVIEPSPYVPEPHPEPVIEPSPYVPEPHPEPVIEPSPYVPEPHPEPPVIEPVNPSPLTEAPTDFKPDVVAPPPDSYPFSPASRIVPPLWALDMDGSDSVNEAEWSNYLGRLYQIASDRANAGADQVAVQLLLSQIQLHYTMFHKCITQHIESEPAELSGSEYERVASRIEKDCYVKFRYSVLGGEPPFEWIAKGEPTITPEQVMAWFGRRKRVAKRDMRNRKHVELSSTELISLNRVIGCIDSIFKAKGVTAIDRDAFYSVASEVQTCMSADH